MTTKNLAFAASIAMLVAISGLASVRAAGSYARDWPAVSGRSDQPLRRAFNASYLATMTHAVDNNKYRYHGGPKSND